jgi:hypothetical protein
VGAIVGPALERKKLLFSHAPIFTQLKEEDKKKKKETKKKSLQFAPKLNNCRRVG